MYSFERTRLSYRKNINTFAFRAFTTGKLTSGHCPQSTLKDSYSFLSTSWFITQLVLRHRDPLIRWKCDLYVVQRHLLCERQIKDQNKQQNANRTDRIRVSLQIRINRMNVEGVVKRCIVIVSFVNIAWNDVVSEIIHDLPKERISVSKFYGRVEHWKQLSGKDKTIFLMIFKNHWGTCTHGSLSS